MSISVDSSVLNERIDRWYGAIKNAQEVESTRIEKELLENLRDIEDDIYTYNYYKLIKFRHFLFLNDLEKAEELLDEIEPFNETSELLQYYYHHFKGFYYYLQRRYQDSLECLKMAQPLIIFCDQQNEIAEFHYKLAASYFELYQNALSIKHIDAASKIFLKNHVYKRSADCELLLALNLRDLREHEEAEVHYHNALRYCDHFKDLDYKHTVLFNLGVFYLFREHMEEAEQYFQKTKTYFLEEKKYKFAVKATYQLSKIHYLNNAIEDAEQYQKDGILLSKQIGDKFYEHKLNMLTIYSKDKFIENESKILEGIHYFEENKLLNEVIEYGEHLITYYHENKSFEKSSMMSKRVIQAKNSLLF